MSNYTENAFINDPNHVWSKILKLVPSNSTVLDIGCSSGNLGAALISINKCTVDGIEPDTKDAALATKKLGKVWSFDVEESSNLLAVDSKYDVIIFADVLEHLLHPSRTLKEVKKLLTKDGIVIFSLPNMAHISTRLALLEGDFSYTETGLLDKTHLHFYNETEILRVFLEAGMVIKQLDYSTYDYPDYLLKQMLSKLGLKPNRQAIKSFHSTSASTFQYVGLASYGAKKESIKAADRLPIPRINHDVGRLVSTINDKDASLRVALKNNADLIESLEALERSYNAVNGKLAAIEKSRMYQLTRKAFLISRKLKRS